MTAARRIAARAAVWLVAAGCLAPGAGAAWERVGPPVATHVARYGGVDIKRIGGTLYVAWTDPRGSSTRVRVARLGPDRRSWVRVGGVVNHDPEHDASCPSLAAGPGGVPWIAWGEIDRGGISQARAAHLGATGGDWVEPDGRDWSINHRPPIWSDLYRVEGQRGRGFGTHCPGIALLGGRPYVSYVNYSGSGEAAPRVVRLARGGHSWRELVGRSEPPLAQGLFGIRLAAIAGRLYAAIPSGAQSQPGTLVVELASGGAWKRRGCVNCTVDGRTGIVGDLAEQAGAPLVLRNAEPDAATPTDEAYVLRFTNGDWHVLGGGPLGSPAGGGVLRTIGGRVYAGWFGRRGSAEHISRLTDDESGWQRLPDPAPLRRLRLSALNGVPYVAGVADHFLRVERLGGAPAPIRPDDDEGSGPGRDPNAQTVPVLRPPHRGPCGVEYTGSDYGDDMSFMGYRGPFEVRGLRGADGIHGGPRDDCLYGGWGRDSLEGGRGNDELRGGRGHDRLYGRAGRDLLEGGVDDDRLAGGRGRDTIHGGAGYDVIHAADGDRDVVYAGRGRDTVIADPFDRVSGAERVRRRRPTAAPEGSAASPVHRAPRAGARR